MTSRLDVGRLRLLHEVGLRGSFAGAARAVGLTPSAVSQQLSVLERETATALLERSPRGVELTDAGRMLADRAGELDRFTGSVAGRVRVAAVASAAVTFVSDAVTELRGTAPGVEVSVLATEPDRGIGLLLSGDVDIAVVDEYDYVPLALPGSVDVSELAVDPLVLVRPVARRRGRRTGLAEFASADWVMPPEDAACGRAVRAACRAAGFEPRVRWETDDMLLLARAVAAGHGIAMLPRRSVADGVTGISLQSLADPAPTRRLLAVARSSVASRPAVAATLTALVAAAQ